MSVNATTTPANAVSPNVNFDLAVITLLEPRTSRVRTL
jgi:hypothetical protein